MNIFHFQYPLGRAFRAQPSLGPPPREMIQGRHRPKLKQWWYARSYLAVNVEFVACQLP